MAQHSQKGGVRGVTGDRAIERKVSGTILASGAYSLDKESANRLDNPGMCVKESIPKA